MSPVIDIRALHFSYGGVPTRSGIDLQAIVGEFLGIVGPNAAGKSTLVRHRTDAIDATVIQDLYGEPMRMIAHAH